MHDWSGSPLACDAARMPSEFLPNDIPLSSCSLLIAQIFPHVSPPESVICVLTIPVFHVGNLVSLEW